MTKNEDEVTKAQDSVMHNNTTLDTKHFVCIVKKINRS